MIEIFKRNGKDMVIQIKKVGHNLSKIAQEFEQEFQDQIGCLSAQIIKNSDDSLYYIKYETSNHSQVQYFPLYFDVSPGHALTPSRYTIALVVPMDFLKYIEKSC